MALTWVEDSKGIRRFDDAALQGAIGRALAALDERNKRDGKKPASIAAVAHGEYKNGKGQADVSLVYRKNPDSDWSVCVAAFKKFNGQFKGDSGIGAQVTWSD